VEKIPCCKYREKGCPLETLISLPSGKKIISILPSLKKVTDILFISASGNCKKVSSSEFISNRKSIIATKLQKDDYLVCAEPVEKKKFLVLKSQKGYLLKISTADIPMLKKNAEGVKGMDLMDDLIDSVFLVDNTDKFFYNSEEVNVAKIKSGKRGSKGKNLTYYKK
jgi:DNA gyrase/topoisomerase IV subunit A